MNNIITWHLNTNKHSFFIIKLLQFTISFFDTYEPWHHIYAPGLECQTFSCTRCRSCAWKKESKQVDKTSSNHIDVSFTFQFLPLYIPSLISITERTIEDLSQRRSTHCHHITLDCFYQLAKRKQKMSQPRGRSALSALPKNVVHSVWKTAKKSHLTTLRSKWALFIERFRR